MITARKKHAGRGSGATSSSTSSNVSSSSGSGVGSVSIYLRVASLLAALACIILLRVSTSSADLTLTAGLQGLLPVADSRDVDVSRRRQHDSAPHYSSGNVPLSQASEEGRRERRTGRGRGRTSDSNGINRSSMNPAGGRVGLGRGAGGRGREREIGGEWGSEGLEEDAVLLVEAAAAAATGGAQQGPADATAATGRRGRSEAGSAKPRPSTSRGVGSHPSEGDPSLHRHAPPIPLPTLPSLGDAVTSDAESAQLIEGREKRATDSSSDSSALKGSNQLGGAHAVAASRAATSTPDTHQAASTPASSLSSPRGVPASRRVPSTPTASTPDTSTPAGNMPDTGIPDSSMSSAEGEALANPGPPSAEDQEAFVLDEAQLIDPKKRARYLRKLSRRMKRKPFNPFEPVLPPDHPCANFSYVYLPPEPGAKRFQRFKGKGTCIGR